MSSLYEEEGNDGYLWCEAETFNAVCYEGDYFPERKLKLFNSFLSLSVPCFFKTFVVSVANMFAVHYLW